MSEIEQESSMTLQLDSLRSLQGFYLAGATGIGLILLELFLLWMGIWNVWGVFSPRINGSFWSAAFSLGWAAFLGVTAFRSWQQFQSWLSQLKHHSFVREVNPLHFRSAAERTLHRVIRGLAKRMEMPVPTIGVYSDPGLNAWSYAFSPKDAILIVSDSLLDAWVNADDANEMARAVIAHELGQIRSGAAFSLTLMDAVGAILKGCFVDPWVNLQKHSQRHADALYSKIRSAQQEGTNSLLFMLVPFFGIMTALSGIAGGLAGIGQVIVLLTNQSLQIWIAQTSQYQADAAAALSLGSEAMISALQSLDMTYITSPEDPRLALRVTHSPAPLPELPQEMRALRVLFPQAYRTHPSLTHRITALQRK
jgi:Zn-dependent protease with chaperone function